jgi:translation elongation factor EF-Tu-like GTPase
VPASAPGTPPFSFTVDDVFYIKPPHDKVILTGAIGEGTVRVGDALVVQCASGDVPVILIGIETLDRGPINEASARQQVGLDVRGIRKDQVTRGDRVIRKRE